MTIDTQALRAAALAIGSAETIDNNALNALHRIWHHEADWMTCQGCKRPIIASRDGEELVHRDGCKHSAEQHPWSQLRAILGAATPAEDRRKKRGTPEDEKCARWLFGLVLNINGGARQPNWPMWADDVRRMREIDGRAHREICEMFKWAHDDSFWCANILSPKKLREKWDTLVAQRARPNAARPGQPSQKFNFANVDRSSDRAAQAATMARHGIAVPEGEVDL